MRSDQRSTFELLVDGNPVTLDEIALDDDPAEAEHLLARITAECPASARPPRRAPGPRRTRRIALLAAAAALAVATPLIAIEVGHNRPSPAIATHPRTPGTHKVPAWHLVGDVLPPGFQIESTTDGEPWNLSCGSSSFCIWTGGIGPDDRSAVMATHDGGKTWSEAYAAPTNETLAGSTCPAATTCMVLAMDTRTTGLRTPMMLLTLDAGANWKSLPVRAAMTKFAQFSCTSSLDCVVTGLGKSPFAAVTSDGGATWMTGTLPSNFLPLGVQCFSAQRCVARGTVATAGHLLTTGEIADSTDGGHTWEMASLPSGTPRLAALACSPTGQCVTVTTVAQRTSGASGTFTTVVDGVLVSNDSGRTWTAAAGTGIATANAPPLLTVMALSCPAATTCWASGSSHPQPGATGGALSTSYRGVVFQTTDGGQRWDEATLPATAAQMGWVSSITCPTMAACFAVASSLTGSPNGSATVLSTDQNAPSPS